jgi:hypothetical protein
MTTRLLIAYSVIALIVLALAVLAARASSRRRRRPSRDHLRVDLFAGDNARSRAQGADESPANRTAAS